MKSQLKHYGLLLPLDLIKSVLYQFLKYVVTNNWRVSFKISKIVLLKEKSTGGKMCSVFSSMTLAETFFAEISI
jgi:hypothetical protein